MTLDLGICKSVNAVKQYSKNLRLPSLLVLVSANCRIAEKINRNRTKKPQYFNGEK